MQCPGTAGTHMHGVVGAYNVADLLVEDVHNRRVVGQVAHIQTRLEILHETLLRELFRDDPRDVVLGHFVPAFHMRCRDNTVRICMFAGCQLFRGSSYPSRVWCL